MARGSVYTEATGSSRVRMSVTPKDRLAELDRLIGEAEKRRIEQTTLIGALVMKEQSIGQAMDDLEETEDLLAQLRAERVTQQGGG